ICPPIRKFSALPSYARRNRQLFEGKEAVLTYCTGGIRCEKASTWLSREFGVKVLMLDGGIHNYLEWVKGQGNEKETGNVEEEDENLGARSEETRIDLLEAQGEDGDKTEKPTKTKSLFHGKNYVFDARLALGVNDTAAGEEETQDDGEIVSRCQFCRKGSERYVKDIDMEWRAFEQGEHSAMDKGSKSTRESPTPSIATTTTLGKRKWKRKNCTCEEERLRLLAAGERA
ncbi:hypothetical protein HK102_004357, partial [Quaeritorhiza haematococci]